MKLFFEFLSAFFFVLALWGMRFSSTRRLWRQLGAQPAGHEPVWRQVSERLEAVAQHYRKPRPALLVLPEFSPNALVLRSISGKVQIGLTEGLVRVLNAQELEAVLALALTHGYRRSRVPLTCMALALLPFANVLQNYPTVVQFAIAPWISGLLRLVGGPARVLEADRLAAEKLSSLRIAAVLQKLGVLGRKVPLRHWNFALDSLFLLSPLTLDGGPFWFFLAQPPVDERRKFLLDQLACESSPSLP
jgi:heat shock protein HtpX